MKTICLSLAAVMALLFTELAFAQEKKTSDFVEKPKDVSAQAGAEKPKPTHEELEAKFRETLTKATFTGRWCMIKDGQLGPEKDEKYTINSVTKIGGEVWLVNARIQYGNKDIVAPVPVQVKWAGDTPVITLDKVGVPGSGEYSARVLIYEKTYAGTWSGGNYGGLLNGVITNQSGNKPSGTK